MGKSSNDIGLEQALSYENILGELNVDDMARRDAENAIPTAEDPEPTLNERTIKNFFREQARIKRNHAKDELDGLKAQMSEIYHSRIVEELNGCPNELGQLNNDSRRKEYQHFRDLRREAMKRETAVKVFARDNELKREPQPTGSPFQIAFWIAAIVLMETMLNATFFAVGSDRGLLGGAIQAVVISTINVMLAWLLGRFCWPKLNHIKLEQKYVGYGFVAALLFAAVSLNLFAGHYRSALENDAFKAVLMAVQSFKGNILAIKSAQGWLLSAVGSAAFICLTIKIYLSDDPYPGYGKVHREHIAARDAWMEQQRVFTDVIINNYSGIEAKRTASTDKLSKLEVGYGVLLDKVIRLNDFYDSVLLQLEGLCNQVVNYYRAENKAFRSNPNDRFPDYYSKPVLLNLEDFDLDIDLETEKSNQKEVATKFDDYRENDSSRIKRELDDIHKLEINNLDEYFGNVS